VCLIGLDRPTTNQSKLIKIKLIFFDRVHGSYEALVGGFTSDALTDFTGGFAKKYHLGAKAPTDLFQLMSKAYRKGTLMGCSINVRYH